MAFIRAANPIWFFNNLVGVPLDDTYYAHFLTNTLPYLPQNVYRDSAGSTVWTGDVVQFGPNGGLPDNLYFDDSLVYRIEIRQGQTQADPLIYEINDFVPGQSINIQGNTNLLTAENQIANSEFSQVNFLTPVGGSQPTITFTVAGTYAIAPGWDLILVGAGSTTVTQLIFSGDQYVATANAPFALRFNSTGWTTATLRQRFTKNGAIWAAGAISLSVTAGAVSTTQSLSANYVPSLPGAPLPIIASHTVNTGVYQVIESSIDVPTPSVNSGLNTVAYVDIQLVLPTNGAIDIANVQVVGQTDPLPNPLPSNFTVPFQQESTERQIDHLFHYYKPGLDYKEIPSYLVGWDFPLNPAQFLGSTVAASAIGANKSKYVWDQTIIFQTANSGVGVSRGTAGEFVFTAAATTQGAVIQYLDAARARKILNDRMCVNLSAYASLLAGISGTISLWYTTDASLPSTVGSNNSLVLTLDANGKPATFNGNWTEVPRELGDATFTIGTTSTTNFNEYGFKGWSLNGIAGANTATFFAIVIGFKSIAIGESVHINSVSLQAGDVPTRPAPQTPDDVIRECQYYYEKSYAPGVVPGANTDIGIVNISLPVVTDGSTTACYTKRIYQPYKQTKRVDPTITFYTPAGTVDNISVGVVDSLNGDIQAAANRAMTGGGSPYTLIAISVNNFLYVNNGNNTAVYSAAVNSLSYEGYIQYHYTLDSRLGI